MGKPNMRIFETASLMAVLVLMLFVGIGLFYMADPHTIVQGQQNNNANSNTANQNNRNSNTTTNSNTRNNNNNNNNNNSGTSGNSNSGAVGNNTNTTGNNNSGMSGNSNSSMSGNSNSSMGGSSNSGMSGNPSMQNMKATTTDRSFIMEAAMGGMAEVEMANLALSKSTSASVKQYAQKMVEDHTANNNELAQVATTQGVTLPQTLNAKHIRLMSKLRNATGASFDKMYISEAGVKAHQDMEKLFQKNMERVSDTELRGYITKTLPVVQEHLRMAREMSNGNMGRMR